MKAKLEQLAGRTHNSSFICYEVQVKAFEFLWHYHPEYELTYIVQGKGKRLVGDGYDHFQEGDFVLLPPMLPHTWISDKNGEGNARAVVVQFSKELVEKLSQFSAMKSIDKLFAKSSRGLHFVHSKNKELLGLLQKMVQGSDLISFTLLLQVLHQLAHQKSVAIASVKYKPLKGNANEQRLNKIFMYVQHAFKEEVSLKQAAALIHLSESAFCKFFKRASGKTFSDYTNEIRIAHACHLLLQTDKPIREVAFESGFESLTYFNRVFLKKKNSRPGEFRKF